MEIEDDIDRRTKPNDVDNLDDLTDNKVHRRLGVRTIIDHEATSNSKFDIEQDSLYEQNNENHNLVDEFKDRYFISVLVLIYKAIDKINYQNYY